MTPHRALLPGLLLGISLGLASCGVVDAHPARTLSTTACMSEADAKDSDSTSEVAQRARHAAAASRNAANSDARYSELAQAFRERSRWYEELVKINPRPGGMERGRQAASFAPRRGALCVQGKRLSANA